MILLICGPPGVGKSTVATRLRERLAESGRQVRLLRSDDFSRRTYERMYDPVAADPEADWILDGTFYRREWRERFRAPADVAEADSAGGRDAPRSDELFVARLRADLGTCLARNRRREESIDERGVHVVYREFEGGGEDLTLDTDALSPAETVERILRALDERGPVDP